MTIKTAADLMRELEGQPKVTLHYDLKHPCADCPFTRNGPRDHPGVLTSLVGYVELIKTGDLVHSCHKTDSRPACDGNRSNDGKVQHCAGLLQMFAKSDIGVGRCIMHAIDRGVELAPLIDRAKANKKVFGSLQQLINHYLGGIRKRMRAMEDSE